MRSWQSPWPQWRSHWHVLHAWPASAQVLVLLMVAACCTVGLSLVYSAQAWQAWWQAEEETHTWQAQIQEVQTQVQAHQARVWALQHQTHPSGQPLPAWDMPPSTTGAQALRTSWLLLAKEHGLQVPTVMHDSTAVWVGPLPGLLAAVQGLPHSLPVHAIDSFELTALPDSKLLQLSVTWSSWADHAAAYKQAQWRKGPNRPSALPTAVSSGVLHNPFGLEGLRQALPDVAQTPKAGALRGAPVSDMRWLGSLKLAGQENQGQALVAYQGLIRQVQVGQAMGQDFGEVLHIAPDHLLLREWHANALGQWQQQTTRFPDRGSP